MNISRILGDLIQTDDGKLEGWCWAIDRPQERAIVEILLNGDVVSTLTAARKRDDLLEMGIGDGYHSFTVPLPELPKIGRHEIIIDARERRSHTLFGRIVVKSHILRDDDAKTTRNMADTAHSIAVQLANYRVDSSGGNFYNELSNLGLLLRRRAGSRNVLSPQTEHSAITANRHILKSTVLLELPYFTAPAVTIIVPAMNTWQATFTIIRRMCGMLTDLKGEVILIDNGTDPTTSLIGTRIRNLNYIRDIGRPLSASAMNIAALNARGRRLFFMEGSDGISKSTFRLLNDNYNNDLIFGSYITAVATRMGLSDVIASCRYRTHKTGIYITMLQSMFVEVGGFDEQLMDVAGIAEFNFVLKAHLLGTGLISLQEPSN